MKTLACWIGRHEWTSRVEQGERYKVCARCDKEPRGPRGATGYGRKDDQGGYPSGGEGGGGDGDG
jgi:hypothetical protein